MRQPYTLLINPPLWNAYAPHLAVPLLAGVLRERGLEVRCHDASVEIVDWLLSADGQRAAYDRRRVGTERHLAARVELTAEYTATHIDEAKAVLRDPATLLHSPQRQSWARRVIRNGMWLVSAAFEGLNFDLVANDLYYSATSTRSVLDSVADPDRNIYAWTAGRLVPEHYLTDSDLAVVGISVSADTQLIAAMTAAARLRRHRPDVRIVMGGNFATRMVERWTDPHPFFRWVDAFVMSEGEDALPQIVERWLRGDEVADIPGVVTKDGESLVRRPARPVRLDNVPTPDFGALPLDRYFAPGPILPIHASRSCAWQCAFCSIPFASNSFRSRPGSHTVDQIEHLATAHSTRFFMFVDEILTLHTMRDVAQEIVDRGLDIQWYGETRFAAGFTRELAELLYRSGCRRLNFGLESYNQRVLDLMRKGTKVEHVDSTLDHVLSAGIAPHLFVIHGFPGETRQEAEDTIDFARQKVQEAATRYGNPYATWGGSPFILDIHSPVAKEPEAFGIRLHAPSPEDDLALVREYTATRGVSSTEAAAVARKARGDTVIRRNVWFRMTTESALAEVEEFTFLRASLKAPNAQPLRCAALFPDSTGDTPLLFDGTFHLLPWTADAATNAAALALYQGHGDRFVQLSWPADQDPDILHSGRTVGEFSDWFAAHGVQWAGETGPALVRMLLRHGFFRSAGANDLVPVGRETVGDWTWRHEPAVLSTGRDELILHSPVTGNTVRVNPLGQLVWYLCEDGAALADIAEQVPPGEDWRHAAEDVLEELATLGFIYPHARARVSESVGVG